MKSPKQRSMENLLHEMEEIMHLIESFEGETLNSPKDLAGMQAEVTFFEQLLDTVKDKHETLPTLGSNESLPNEEMQELVSESKLMEQKTAFLEKSFSEALKRNKKQGKGKETAAMRERKKLFKTLGGDKKWIPL